MKSFGLAVALILPLSPMSVITGTVLSARMQKTVIAEVVYTKLIPKYDYWVKKRTKYAVHDPDEQCNIGDVIK